MKRFQYIFLLIMLSVCIKSYAQQPFTPGNIVVYRIGDGSGTLGLSMSKVYLDEFTPTGTLVQSILMPTTGKKISMYGSSTDAGLISLSANGKYIVVPGWDVNNGVTPTSLTGIGRSIGLVDVNGDVSSVTVVSNNPGGSGINGVSSADGNGIWLTGGLQLEYVPVNGTTSTVVASNLGGIGTAVSIAGGQLYTSSNNRNIPLGRIGTGLPITIGQTYTAVPGLPSRTNPRQFAFADLDPTVPGADVLYLASISGTIGGLQKYSLVGGTWVSNGVIGTPADNYAGLTIKTNGSSVTIFATRQGSNTSLIQGGELVSLIDNSGYRGAFTGTPTVLATAGASDSKSFRGIAFVPEVAPFTPGNIVVYRVGDGNSTLGVSMSKVYLDEYTTSGNLVQSILMPTTGKRISLLGSASNGGLLSLSTNGKHLVVAGWDVEKGAAPTTIVGLNRSIGLVDFNAKVNDVAVITSNPGNSQPVGAASFDGTGYWLTGSRVEYIPAGGGTPTILANFLSPSTGVTISEGQLYFGSTAVSQSLNKIGNGLPTTAGQTVTSIGLPDRTSPRQFAFADLEPGIPGMDVLYVASLSSTTGGIQKYSLVNGVWVFNGAIGSSADVYSGLTIKVAANSVMIFATRQGSNTAPVLGGELVRLIDNSGYNGTLTGTPTVLASVGTLNTKAFRGIAPAPSGCPPVSGLFVPEISSTRANIRWSAPTVPVAGYEYAVTTSIVPPASGTFTSFTSAQLSGLVNGTTYYVHVRTGCDATSFSEWTTISFVTGCKPPPSLQLQVQIDNVGLLKANWNQVFGASSYEYFISTSAAAPASGIAVTDTTFTYSGLQSVTQYYLHVRSNCSGGAFSPWTTKSFTSGCFTPVPTATFSANTGVTWNRVANAVKYEYVLSNSPAKPLSGVITTDTFAVRNKLDEGGQYYFHIRSVCSQGSVSDWSTLIFNTIGLNAYPNPVTDVLRIKLSGINNTSGEVSIGDAMGRVIAKVRLSGGIANVNAKHWAPGVYLVRYHDGKHQYMVRIVKQ